VFKSSPIFSAVKREPNSDCEYRSLDGKAQPSGALGPALGKTLFPGAGHPRKAVSRIAAEADQMLIGLSEYTDAAMG